MDLITLLYEQYAILNLREPCFRQIKSVAILLQSIHRNWRATASYQGLYLKMAFLGYRPETTTIDGRSKTHTGLGIQAAIRCGFPGPDRWLHCLQ